MISPPSLESLVADLANLRAQLAERDATIALYRAMAHTFPNGALMLFDHELRYRLADGAGLADLNLSTAQLEGRTLWEVFPPETVAAIAPAYRAALAGSARVEEVQYGDRTYEMRTQPVYDEDGRVIAGMMTTQEITARLRVEHQAQAQAELFQLVLAQIGDGVIVADPSGAFEVFNPAAARIFGSGATDTSADGWAERYGLYLPDQTTPFPTAELPLVRAINGEATEQVELFVRHAGAPEGIWTAVSGWPLRDAAGNSRGGVVVCRDDSARKQSAAALARKEQELFANMQRLQAIVANVPIIFYTLDRDGVITLSEGRGLERLGLTAGQLVGQSVFDLYAHDPAIVADMRRALQGERLMVERATGEQVFTTWFEPLYDATGESIGIAGLSLDVTDRARAEAAQSRLLAEAEWQRERLNSLVASVPGVVWESWGQPNTQTERTNYVSDYIVTMTGYTINDWLTTPNFWLRIVHPDDQERAAREGAAIFASGAKGRQEYRWVTKDGRVLWAESHAVVIRDADGTPVGLRGVTLDVTDRKVAEAEQSRLQEAIIQMQDSTLRELSTPLIPISDTTMVMPLIGAMDSRRAQQVLESLLEGVADTGAQVAIIDITGVPVVDTQVASVLMQAAQAVRLLGAQVVLTGIRPEVAQTLVGLGIDLGGVVTRSTLQRGIAYATRGV